ncbi:FkbM family methyltransferase [Belliella sp. DSM 107340]|uniref:FkbM family methyltransferase n=1 Tax=Belliella calami TaxID=2923436 RepID=A0ABS9UIS9_9BACT|nr:FkbM family methyltransferase [Belliella calami]MCH7396521.1 FkbM family methyltransferase [Belliella calami]
MPKVPKFLFPYLYGSAFHRAWFSLYGVVIKEVRFSFKQFFTFKHPVFSFFHSISVIFSAFNRVLLGRSLKYSFAFTGEDRIIEALLSPKITEEGFYVEVGSNHPKFLSNTYSLYRKGWKGICIDANPKFNKIHNRLRPNDIVITALISNEENTRPFYFVQNDVLSSIDQKVVNQYRKDGLEVNETIMKTTTLAKIFAKHQVPKYFDLLIIDAEEHDREVLEGMDWENFKPKWVIIEDETWGLSNNSDNSILPYMLDRGYQLEGWILKNLYFEYKKEAEA